MKVYKCCLHAV